MICHEGHTGEDAERVQQESDAHLERQRDEAMVTDNPNPLNARCGLKDCDCEYTIGGLLLVLRQVRKLVQAYEMGECPDEDAECPCYQAGLQEGRESERRPIGE